MNNKLNLDAAGIVKTLPVPQSSSSSVNTDTASLPNVWSRTKSDGLLKQAGPNKLSGFKLNVAYLAFLCAITLNKIEHTSSLIHRGVLEKITTEKELASLITELLGANDTGALEAMLHATNTSGMVAKAFSAALQTEMKMRNAQNVAMLFEAINKCKPEILYTEKDKKNRPILGKLIYYGSKGSMQQFSKAALRSIAPDIYQKAYPDPNRLRDFLHRIVYAEMEDILQDLISSGKIKIHPSVLRNLISSIVVDKTTTGWTESAIELVRRAKIFTGAHEMRGNDALKNAIELEEDKLAEEILKHWKPHINNATLKELLQDAASKKMTNVIERLARVASMANSRKISSHELFSVVLRAGNEQQIQALLDGGLELNPSEKENLIKSFQLSNEGQRLIREGKPNVLGAIDNNNIEKVLFHAKKAGTAIPKESKNLDEWLLSAAIKGRMEMVEILSAAGARVGSIKDRAGRNALHWLCSHQYCDAIGKLVEDIAGGAPELLNQQAEDGSTPLMIAAKAGQHEIVKALILKGANISLRDNQNKQAIHYAVESKNRNAIADLSRHFKPSVDDAKEILRLAVETKESDVIEFVARKVKTVLSDPEHFTNIFSHPKLGYKVQALLNAGISPTPEQIKSLVVDSRFKTLLERGNNRANSAIIMDALWDEETPLVVAGFEAPAQDDDNPLGLRDPWKTLGMEQSTAPRAPQNRKPNTHQWRLEVNPGRRPAHPVARFLQSLPKLAVSGNANEFFGNWQSGIVMALLAMPGEEGQLVSRLREILDDDQLGLCLQDEYGAPINFQQPNHEALIEAQFVAIDVSHNERLHSIANDVKGLFAPKTGDSSEVARSKVAAKAQAGALIEANEAFRPFCIGLRDQCNISKLEDAVHAGSMTPSQARRQIEDEIDTRVLQSSRFTKILIDGMPDTLQAWLGNEVVRLHAKRGQELRDAHARFTRLE
ncbi:ankyrin repeat domain-containing protein [Noviherbaspirillum pedocola]|uniref:Ankyrin repeat domain-containing protein n=1 Tax=Noviherbaspirillum pedocola TaxID=2801341 RepID=A0A934W7B1_9BURK|nr:ankyrin repeat domain-containing protein [Noviherbaspirillum pedocola]MBK4734484.1 ankyrin repeat domain-containing protein [Noviherbaspirillum pedocola]